MAFRGYRLGLFLALAGAVCAWGQGGPPGATVNELLTFPGNATLIYAATNRGVFASNDAGQTWFPRSIGLSVGLTRAIAGSPGRLYAGTFGGGVFRSDDGGQNWAAMNTGLPNLNVDSLAVDSTNSNIVFAGTLVADQLAGGIYKSSDGGANWALAGQGIPGSNYRDIAVSHHDPNLIFAAGTTSLSPAAGGLIRSRDGGAQWQTVASVSLGFFHVSFDPVEANVVHIGTSAGYLRSDNAGDSFVVPSAQVFRLNDLVFAPNDPNVLFGATSGSGLITSSDRGATWFVAGTGFTQLTQFDTIAALGDTPARILAGGSGPGVFRSADLGMTWQLSSSGMNIADVAALAIHPTAGDQLLAGVFGGTVFRTENGGSAWTESRAGLSTFGLAHLLYQPSNPATVYAGSINPNNSFDGAVFRSQDSGRTWETRFAGIPVFDLAHHPSDGQTLYAASRNAIARTRDGGGTFVDVGIGCDGFQRPCRYNSIAVDPGNGSRLYSIFVDESQFSLVYQFIRSDNGGNSWSGSGATAIPLLTITVDPTNTERIFIGALSGIFRSTNRGQTFSDRSNGLPTGVLVRVDDIVVDASDGGVVYAATSEGVYKSTNSGDNWSLADEGLGALIVQKLAVHPSRAKTLYAGTFEGGVYKTVDGGQIWLPSGGIPAFGPAGLVGALDFVGGGVAAGELVSLFGVDLGPLTGTLTGFDSETGKLPTSQGGISVFFDEFPAALIFFRDDQINLQVPYEVAGRQSVQVRVSVAGVDSQSVTVPLLATHAGIHPNVLNQDFTLNSVENPEIPGRIIQIFVSGQGPIMPALMTGEPAPGMLPVPEPVLPVEVTIGGVASRVIFRGMAPGFVGLLQINVEVDITVPAGEHDVVVTIGGQPSTSATTVFVTRGSI